MKCIKARGIKVIVYEPVINEPELFRSPVVNDLKAFKQQADIILAKRVTVDVEDVRHKYTPEIYMPEIKCCCRYLMPNLSKYK